jgi:phosphopantothenoylcysteine decarboxylase/phosphopantothenate--cysteine ligase
MAAAVSDYTPVKVSRTKIKKGKKSLLLKLKPTFDILKWAGQKKIKNKKSKIKNKILVGFALEDKNVKANAQKKLKEKNLDMIIANKPEAIGGDYSSLLIKTPFKPWQSLAKASKRTLSEKIISLIEQIITRCS